MQTRSFFQILVHGFDNDRVQQGPQVNMFSTLYMTKSWSYLTSFPSVQWTVKQKQSQAFSSAEISHILYHDNSIVVAVFNALVHFHSIM